MLRPACVLENMLLIIDTFTCVFACLEFTYCVSTIGNWIALGLYSFETTYVIAERFTLSCLCLYSEREKRSAHM